MVAPGVQPPADAPHTVPQLPQFIGSVVVLMQPLLEELEEEEDDELEEDELDDDAEEEDEDELEEDAEEADAELEDDEDAEAPPPPLALEEVEEFDEDEDDVPPAPPPEDEEGEPDELDAEDELAVAPPAPPPELEEEVDELDELVEEDDAEDADDAETCPPLEVVELALSRMASGTQAERQAEATRTNGARRRKRLGMDSSERRGRLEKTGRPVKTSRESKADSPRGAVAVVVPESGVKLVDVAVARHAHLRGYMVRVIRGRRNQNPPYGRDGEFARDSGRMNPIKRDSRAESSPPRLQFWQTANSLAIPVG
jgi:hypothetical protein